jgi:hypothetical protein
MAQLTPGSKGGKFKKPKADPKTLKRQKFVDEHAKLDKAIAELVGAFRLRG